MRAAWWAAGAMACSLVACQQDEERPGISGDRGVVVDGAIDGGRPDHRGVGDGPLDRGLAVDRGVEPDGTPVSDAGDGGGLLPDAGDAGSGDMGLRQPEFECPDCGPDAMCFQFYDGTCDLGQPRCIPRVEGCAPRTCTPECEDALCSDGGVPFSSCDTGLACGSEAEGAFVCYGP